MRTLSTGMSAAIASEQAIGAWLLQVSLTSTFYYTNADVDIPYGGNKYISRGFEVTEIQQSANFSNDLATIEFDNVGREMSALFLAEDVANKTVICNLAIINANTYQVSAAAEMLRGYITAWNIDEEKASIKLGSEFMLWSKKTLRLPTPNCPWSFKGTECAYAGDSDWCDKSPERCAVLDNYVNFGGRKFISDIEGQKIFWGPRGY